MKNSNLIIYQLAFLPIILLSLLRAKPFSIYFEEMDLFKNIMLVFSLIFLLSVYIYLINQKARMSELRIKVVLKLLIPLFVLLIVTPPLFSRDILSYLIPARNLIVYKQDPYTTFMQNYHENSWSLYVQNVYNGTSVYAPFFNILMSTFLVINSSNIYLYVIFFKIFTFILFLLDIKLIQKIVSQLQLSPGATIMFILNPSILIHLLLDAHNEGVMLTLILLGIYLFNKNEMFKSCVSLILSACIKYVSIIIFPIFCFKHGKVLWKNLVFFVITAVAVIVVQLLLFPSFIKRFEVVSGTQFTSGCLYACTPTTAFYSAVFGVNAFVPRILTFVIIWLTSFYFFVLRKDNKLAFIISVFLGFNLFVFTWVTSWSFVIPLTLCIILSNNKWAKIGILIITAYSLLHYYGV